MTPELEQHSPSGTCLPKRIGSRIGGRRYVHSRHLGAELRRRGFGRLIVSFAWEKLIGLNVLKFFITGMSKPVFLDL